MMTNRFQCTALIILLFYPRCMKFNNDNIVYYVKNYKYKI